MEITLVQGLLLSLIAFICSLDQQAEVFLIFRPIVVCFFSGIVLGDMPLGLSAGAVAELAYLGLLTIGGTVPPNPLIAGIMTVVIAHTSGVSAEAALGLSLPFALLGQWIGMILSTVYSGLMPIADRYCAEADVSALGRLVIISAIGKSLVTAVIIFLSAYLMQAPITALVETFPVWLIRGFRVAGNLLPGVGLALLLKVMLKIDNIAYLFIGFLIATYIPMGNVLPIAILAVCITFLSFINSRDRKAYDGGVDDDGI